MPLNGHNLKHIGKPLTRARVTMATLRAYLPDGRTWSLLVPYSWMTAKERLTLPLELNNCKLSGRQPFGFEHGATSLLLWYGGPRTLEIHGALHKKGETDCGPCMLCPETTTEDFVHELRSLHGLNKPARERNSLSRIILKVKDSCLNGPLRRCGRQRWEYDSPGSLHAMTAAVLVDLTGGLQDPSWQII